MKNDDKGLSPFQTYFPNIDHWCNAWGWIEIGQDDYSRSLVRALDHGGMIWESKRNHKTVGQALEALEKFLDQVNEKNG